MMAWAEIMQARHLSGSTQQHSKALPLQNIVGKTYTLEKANEGLADVEALAVTKAPITP